MDLTIMNGTLLKLCTLIAALLLQMQIVIGVFSCDGKISGYYADIETGCQVYHMCDGLGRQFSYTCPNATLFQQRMLICDHWYMVNCSKSEDDYIANSLIGQKEKPFVDDSVEQPYRRTPRPDLTTYPSETESEIIYQTKGRNAKSSSNLVGSDFEVESDKKATSIIDETNYAVPSHWSTEYRDDITTSKIYTTNYKSNSKNNIRKTQYRTNQPALESSTSPTLLKTSEKSSSLEDSNNLLPKTRQEAVIFASDFNSTTPVYPNMPQLYSDVDVGLLPPLLNRKLSDMTGTHDETGELVQNEKNSVPNGKVDMNLKVNSTTTPTVHSTKSELRNVPQGNIGRLIPSLEKNAESQVPPLKNMDKNNARMENVLVNFESNFKATTPVYPKASELLSPPQDIDIGLLPPIEKTPKDRTRQRGTEEETKAVNFKSNYEATTPNYPSTSELREIPIDDDIGLLPPRKEEQMNRVVSKQDKQSTEVVNFESNFKATTPVYPKLSDLANIAADIDIGLLPPLDIQSSENGKMNVVVNFHSTFKATTPVYPSLSELSIGDDESVGLEPPASISTQQDTQQLTVFPSNYNNTTPVYPEFVEQTEPLSQEIGLLPPIAINEMLTTGVSRVPSSIETVMKLDSRYQESSNKKPAMEPSKHYQPPKFEPDYTQIYNTKEKLIRTSQGLNISEFLKTMNAEQWKTLRKELLIPDYEFPLDPVSRPSYEGGISSFQVKPVSVSQ